MSMNDLSKKVVLEPQSIVDIERFVDTICDQHLINDTYYGSILIALTEMFSACLEKHPSKFLKIRYATDYQKVTISFQPVDAELVIGFTRKIGVDFDSEINIEKSIFIITSLTDSVKVIGSDSIEISFDISDIHNVASSHHRLDELSEYFSKSQKAQLAKKYDQF